MVSHGPGFPFQDEVLYDRISTLLSQLPARQSVPQKFQVVPKQQCRHDLLLCMLRRVNSDFCTSELSCCIRELLEQFTIERGYAHILLNPYIVNGVARGCQLQSFADTWLQVLCAWNPVSHHDGFIFCF